MGTDRKYYIDNLRSFTILFLFPYHIFRLYNGLSEGWYIQGEHLLIPDQFIRISNLWMMQLLFTVAGISVRYALERRSAGEFAKERVSKLLLPFIFGMLLVVPVQPYIAGIIHNGHAGYFDFFTKLTDFTGYDGAFTPGHLWFLLFLFAFSLIYLPFLILYKKKGKGTLADKVPLILIILMGLIPCIVQMDVFEPLEPDGKSPLEFSAYFLLGYFFLSNNNLLKKLDKHRFLLLGSFILYTAFMFFILDGEFYEVACWLAILTILGMGRHYLDFRGKITSYLAKSSFGVYIFHQSWIVVAAFFVFKIADNPAVQMPLIFLSAISLTYLTYEICKRVGALRWMFGIKK